MTNPLMSASLARRGAVYFPCVDSTNQVAKQLARQGAPHMTLVLADEQTAGRGRRGKSWLSRPGLGVWMTLIVRPDVPAVRAPELVMVTAVALCRALRDLTAMDAMIKWPNDVLCMEKKLSGTLLELSADGEQAGFAVIGVGINVLGMAFPPDLPDAASIQSVSGKVLRRCAVAEAFLDAFEDAYKKWAQDGMARIMPAYKGLSSTLGAKVKALCPDGEVFGTCVDIAQDGALLLRLDDGTVRPLYAGDVSIRDAIRTKETTP